MKRFFIINLVAIMLLSSFAVFAEPTPTTESQDSSTTVTTPPDITATAAIVIDAQTGQVLYEKNAHESKYPASITKIMTGLLAIENGDWSDSITFSENAIWGIERDSTHIALDVDEVISFKDCLNAILIVSANEAALGMAEYIGGSDENFYKMMNDRAKELGCLNTNFTNPHGLPDDNHYTTAYDMALITKKALEYDQFREITGTIKYVIEPTNKQSEPRELWADNRLILESSDYYYEYCEGGKTGYTDLAQGTLVSWAKKGDMELITVILETSSVNTYVDAAALFEYCFNNFTTGTPITNYTFVDSDYSTVKTILENHFEKEIQQKNITLSVDFSTPVTYNSSLSVNELVPQVSYLNAPTDGVIGTLTYTHNGTTLFSYNILVSGYEAALSEAVEEKTKDKPSFLSILGTIIIVIVILALIIGGLMIYTRILNIKRRKNRLSKRKRR